MALSLKYVLVILFTLTVTVSIPLNHEETVKCTNKTTCFSKNCDRTSNEISKLLNVLVNPCEDFYNFACGGYLKNNIPEDQIEISQLNDITNIVHNQFYTALNESIAENEPKSSMLVKKLFKVCTDTETIEKIGLSYIKSLIKELGGWPLVDGDTWEEESFDWKNLTFKLRKFGFRIESIISIRVEENINNSSTNIVTINQPRLPLSRLNLLNKFNNSIIMENYQSLIDIAAIFGAKKHTSSGELIDVFEFLFELGKITVPPEELENTTALPNIMTIGGLNRKVPSIDWVNYINNIIAIPEIIVTEADLVDVVIPKFLINLETLLQKTPKRVLANYIMTVAIVSIKHTLNKKVSDHEFSIKKKLFGITAPPRWKECTLIATETLNIAASALYSRKYFDEESKKNVEIISTNVHKQFIKMLQEVDWMDSDTKNKALAKAQAMEFYIGYPKELLDDKALEDHYANLNFSENYTQYILNIQKSVYDNMYKSLTKPIDRSNWKDQSVSHDVNAYYNSFENFIVLPAGILQGAMFNKDRPNYMNYAGIGFVAGHEMTHGFDDQGKEINKEGQLESWWSLDTEKLYEKKAQCIVRQYRAYHSSKAQLNVNGITTLSENIADNGGIKIAYEAYQEWVKQNGPEECLPNLNYTPNQLFWISLANTWCAKERVEQLRSIILTKSHPPSNFRIHGIIANSKYFINDFNCPVESKMNAPKKCTFW